MYNALVQLGAPHQIIDFKPAFNETDFPIVLFESRKGDVDPQTGVPPALFTASWNFTPSKPAQVLIKSLIEYFKEIYIPIYIVFFVRVIRYLWSLQGQPNVLLAQ